MANWTKPLPSEAVEGSDTHVADHNLLIAAFGEVRSNVDEIELTPGPKGEPGTPGTAGAKGDTGAAGADGFPSEVQWDALVARVDALAPVEG